MSDKHESLASALAAFQADLPKVGKGASGQVPGKKDYKYADLADTNGVILPALGRLGLSFSAKPTLNADGVFVLAYVLRHTSGEFDGGEWKLPQDATPQQMGSAITYARRYALQAVTGVAPDEDDDGQAANAPHEYSAPRRQPPQQRRPEPEQQSDVDVARDELAAAIASNSWDPIVVRKRYAAQYGHPLREAAEAPAVRAFTKLLYGASDEELKAPATNGAAQ